MRVRFFKWLMAHVADRRHPDVIVGDPAAPYLRRWWLLPHNPLFNIYLHEFQRSDDDRALHDHPWVSFSWLLEGQYVEHTIAAGGVHYRRRYTRGQGRFRRARFAHRLEVNEQEGCWTLFVTGPRVREWGFHCKHGWVPWWQFTDPATNGTTVGRGCGE